MAEPATKRLEAEIGPNRLPGFVGLPADPLGLVIFAHGSGSGRLSTRNTAVAAALAERGLATLLLDLLTEAEAVDRRNVFDIDLLGRRVVEAMGWSAGQPSLAGLPVGLFGASTGGAAALVAAAQAPDAVRAVVSRGGRPDLAAGMLPRVRAPTLLLVGSHDRQVVVLNRRALALLTCEKRLELIEGATHLFEEPGTLEAVTARAGDWFVGHLPDAAPGSPGVS